MVIPNAALRSEEFRILVFQYPPRSWNDPMVIPNGSKAG